MAAGNYDIPMKQNSAYNEVWRWMPGGVAADLTGYIFKGQVRSRASSTVVLGAFVFTLLDQTNPATKGMVRVQMTSANVALMTVDPNKDCENNVTDYPYDMYLQPPGGDWDCFSEGCVLLKSGVTRP